MFRVKNMDTGAGDPLQFYTNRYDLERLVVNPNYYNDGIQYIWQPYRIWTNQTYRFYPAPALVDDFGVDYRIIITLNSADIYNDPGPFGTLYSPFHPNRWSFSYANQTMVIVGRRDVVNDILGSLYFNQNPEWSVDVIGGFYVDITVGDVNTAFLDLEYHQLVLVASYENNYSLARADQGTKGSTPKPTKRKSVGNVKKKTAYSTTFRANGFTRRSGIKTLPLRPLARVKPGWPKRSGATAVSFKTPDFLSKKSVPFKTQHSLLLRSGLKFKLTKQSNPFAAQEYRGTKIGPTAGKNPVIDWIKTVKHSLLIPYGPAQEFRTGKAYNDNLRVLSSRKYRIGAQSNPGRLMLAWDPVSRSINPFKRILNSRTVAGHLNQSRQLDAMSKFKRPVLTSLFTVLSLTFEGTSLTQWVRQKNTSKLYHTGTKFVQNHRFTNPTDNSIVMKRPTTALKWAKGERKLYMGYKVIDVRYYYIKPIFNYGLEWSGKGTKVFNSGLLTPIVLNPPFGRYSGGITNIFAYKFTGRISG